MQNSITVNLTGMLLVLGAVQGFFLAALLFTKYRKHPANRYLGFLILAYSAFILSFMISGIPYLQENYPHWLMTFSGLPFLFGPLHMIYVAELTDSHIKFSLNHFLR